MRWDKTVLVIDDSRTILKTVSDMLVTQKRQSILTSTMEDALNINIKQHVDVVMLELMLPDTDGLEAIAKIRQQDPGVKIIAMTSGNDAEASYKLLRKARHHGADVVIRKPFDGPALQTLLDTINHISGRGVTRLLAIDDSKTVCKAIEKMLAGTKIHVITASSAQEAFERPDILGIDIVLTEIFMPGESGIDVIQNCAARWPHIQVIAMSAGYGEEVEKSKALLAATKIGADHTLNKPFTKEQLLKVIHSVQEEPSAQSTAAS